MKILSLITIILLTSTNLVFADIIVSGNRITYTSELKLHTRGYTTPENPSINDLYTDLDTNDLYKWNGTEWELINLTPAIKQQIQNLKDNFKDVSPGPEKKCIKALGKIVLYLYRESLE